MSTPIRYGDADIERALTLDGLATAEQITGQSYKSDEETSWLGLALHIRNVEAKRRMLDSRGDSHGSTTLADYIGIVRRLGFESALTIPFTENREGRSEEFQVWWQPVKAILLAFDTYYGCEKVNGGKFYYNWKPNQEHDWDATSSGGFDASGIWSGNHDCREAIAFNIQRLDANGSFVNPWVRRPFMWLLHFMDKDQPGYDYEAINAARIDLLPAEVQKAIEATP